MNPVYMVAIDIGSSFIKTAVLDLAARRIVARDKTPAPHRIAHPDPRCFEIPAEHFVRLVRACIDSYAARLGSIAGILLCTQMHGFVYRPSTDCVPEQGDTYVSWQDARCLNPLDERDGTQSGENALDRLQRLISPQDMRECGVYLKPSLGLCNLYALLHTQGLPDDGELFTLGSYIIWRLTGRNICHLQNAAPLGVADVEHARWNRIILQRAGLGRVRLPELAGDDFAPCGFYAVNGQKIPLYPDYGDQQAAILGCGAGMDEAVVNAATAAQVCRETAVFRPGPYEIRPYFTGGYLRTISNMPSGRCLDVLVRFVQDAVERVTGRPAEPDAVWRAVREGFVPDGRGLEVDLGFFAAPGQYGGGSIRAITPENLSLPPLFAAALKEMARVHWENILMLDSAGPSAIVSAGGVSWNVPELRCALARESRLPVRLSPLADEVFAGLFRAGLVCAGILTGLRDRPELTLLPKEG